ncbi:Phosphodiest-domain-containing protein [Rhizodiscina lignyota]|uniref:Phosphodiest-domain-containing protein n=1 Tax=Rhizodiscina lignyota TaxID=1504668 RepID=A0A9P4IGT1_9PEZI|nr:Phosphodiest-domain-containing protein [Rhizodiscina lignyota]
MPLIDREKKALLSTDQYDDDAPDVESSRRSIEARVEEEDESVDGRTSNEIAERDREVLEDDYEGEELIPESQRRVIKGLFGGAGNSDDRTTRKESTRKDRRERRDGRRSKRRKRLEGESELMYEMEEGGRLTPSSEEEEPRESVGSSEADLKRLGDVRKQKSARRKLIFRRMAIHLAIILLFAVLLYAAYRASKSTKVSTKATQALLSNGSAFFPPTTILVSLDGFRADFLQRGLTPTLNSFIAEGISPLYMLPSFPSVTFPNHYTMATGMYPEAHGIVGNTFWDTDFEEEFYYTHPKSAKQPKWWGGEPLWVTAENQGVRSAIHMWPGSEAHIGGIEPAHVDKYNGSEVLEHKVKKVLQYIDLPGQEHEEFSSMRINEQRPQLVLAYVPVVDTHGHKYGPNSTEIRQTIKNVDDMLKKLFEGLQARNLTQLVNVVVVSDHGMATTDVTRLMQLEDLVDTSKIEHTDGWPLYGLRPKNIKDLESLYNQVKENTKDNPNVEIYLRDKNMPERYHFSNNDRIAPLWIVPKAGWAIVKKDEFDVQEALKNGDVYHPRGLHGYDHEHPLMRAIFVARGPAFPHKPNSRVEVFQNTEVYNIVCDSIGLSPAPNNGTLRLPLKPIGLHSDPETPKLDTPDDPPTHTLTPVESAAAEAAAGAASSALAEATKEASELLSDQSPVATETQAADDGSEKNRINKWWQWLADKLDHAKDWAKGVFGSKGKGHTDSG